MLLNKLLDDVEAKTGVRKFLLIVLVSAVLGNVLQAANALMTDKSIRIQLVPAEISKGFWVDGSHLSPEYLEQMGEYIALKYANVSPSSVDDRNAQILKYVHPSVHGELSIRFKASADKLKANNISRTFIPKEVKINEAKQAVAFIGFQETWVADKKVQNPEVKAYLVAFDYTGGHTTLKELRETNELKPFDSPEAAPPAAQ